MIDIRPLGFNETLVQQHKNTIILILILHSTNHSMLFGIFLESVVFSRFVRPVHESQCSHWSLDLSTSVLHGLRVRVIALELKELKFYITDPI